MACGGPLLRRTGGSRPGTRRPCLSEKERKLAFFVGGQRGRPRRFPDRPRAAACRKADHNKKSKSSLNIKGTLALLSGRESC